VLFVMAGFLQRMCRIHFLLSYDMIFTHFVFFAVSTQVIKPHNDKINILLCFTIEH